MRELFIAAMLGLVAIVIQHHTVYTCR